MQPEDREPDPFTNLGAEPTDRVPRPMTATHFVGAILGFLFMGVGGICLGIGVLMKDSPWRITLPIGMILCPVGYALFRRKKMTLEDLPDISD
jgi:hypothetical protein